MNRNTRSHGVNLMRTLGCLIIALAVCCNGCLLNHTQKRVIRENEARFPVQFESQNAAESFHTIANSEDIRKSLGSSASFGVPFLIGLSRESVPSQNAFYNDQVIRCDINSDGFISDQEANSFSEARYAGVFE